VTKKRKKKRTHRSNFATAQQVTDRILAEGPDYLDKNLIRMMMASADLRDEREFADLALDPQRTLEVAARHFPRFRRHILRAAERNKEKAGTVYDDYRIAAMEELDTPQLREDLRQRLDRFIARAQHRGDSDKLEAAILLSMFLDEGQKVMRKPMPLGVCSLMVRVYEESLDRAMAEVPDAEEIAGEDLTEIWRDRHVEEDMAAIAAATEKAKSLDDLDRRIQNDPDLALAWRRQAPNLLEELEREWIHCGADFVPGHFTAEEVARAMERMERKYLSKPWHLSRYILPWALVSWFQVIQETLEEVVTPERQGEIAAGLRAAGQRALESDNAEMRQLAPHFRAAAESVASADYPPGNGVLRSMFLVSFYTWFGDTETLSPQWQRFIDKAEKSRFLRSARGDEEV